MLKDSYILCFFVFKMADLDFFSLHWASSHVPYDTQPFIFKLHTHAYRPTRTIHTKYLNICSDKWEAFKIMLHFVQWKHQIVWFQEVNNEEGKETEQYNSIHSKCYLISASVPNIISQLMVFLSLMTLWGLDGATLKMTPFVFFQSEKSFPLSSLACEIERIVPQVRERILLKTLAELSLSPFYFVIHCSIFSIMQTYHGKVHSEYIRRR